MIEHMLPAGTLTTPEGVERLRRSVAVLPPQAPALNQEDAIEVQAAVASQLPQRSHRDAVARGRVLDL